MRRHPVVVLAAAGLLSLVACDDGPQEPAIGALRVSVATAGGDLDLDGYTIALDGGSPQPVPIDASVVVPDLATGSHDVALGNVAANCTVAGPNPSAVSVTRGDTAQTSFAVACVATGIRITAATTGLDLDPDGYTVSLDGAAPVPLPLNGSVTISRLAAGAHVLVLGGRAANCTAGGTNPLSLDVPAGEIVAVFLPVTCVATTGVIEVTAATSGLDLDANGYSVQVDGGTAVAVGVNGTVRFPGVPGGSHEITLAGAVDNCSIGGPNPRTVSVTVGGLTRDTARTTFAASCVAVSGVIEVTTATTGVDLDADGYTVQLDDATSAPSAVNGTIRLAGVPGGDHSVTLTAVAPNCLVGGDNPRAVSITTGGLTRDTARTSFAVTCEPTTGTARIVTATSGADRDADGYWMAIDYYDYYGYPYYFYAEQMAGNDTVIVTQVPSGDHTFEIQQVAPNCSVAAANPRTVRVAGGTVTDVVFDVTCAALGSVEVRVSTTGVDLDPDGYTVAVVGPGYSTSGPVGVNGSATFPAIPPGNATVTLDGVTSNCAVAGGKSRAVSVPSGAAAGVAFDITCAQTRQLAVVSRADGNEEIYLVRSNGTGLTRLTANAASDSDPAWSPDGSRIAFTSERDGNREVYVMSADGSNPVRLTSAAAPDYQPSWSPDGTEIAFTSERDGNAEIYVIDADGSSAVRLTTAGAADADPAWSPDGTRIAFSSSRTGTGEIYVMNADGSNPQRLTTSGENYQPAWSPDGARLAFRHDNGCYYWCDYDLFVMNADGSAVVRATSGDPPADADPDWSRDGAWIAFATVTCDYYGCPYSAVAAVRPNGADRTEILRGPVFHPVWRP